MTTPGVFAGRTFDRLVASEREALRELATRLGVPDPKVNDAWWGLHTLRDPYRDAAARRLVDDLVAGGDSFTAACREAAAHLGYGSARTLRRRLRDYERAGGSAH